MKRNQVRKFIDNIVASVVTGSPSEVHFANIHTVLLDDTPHTRSVAHMDTQKWYRVLIGIRKCGLPVFATIGSRFET